MFKAVIAYKDGTTDKFYINRCEDLPKRIDAKKGIAALRVGPCTAADIRQGRN